jgi:hypothetical protein
MTRKWVAILAASAACVCGLFAGTASADTSQAGCQAYGQFIAATAQAPGNAGQEIVAATATSGAGAVAALSEVLRQATCP